MGTSKLDNDLELGPVLVMVAQGRQRYLRFTRLAVTQNDQPGRRNPFGQYRLTQGEGGKRLQLRVQRGEDGFAGGGH